MTGMNGPSGLTNACSHGYSSSIRPSVDGDSIVHICGVIEGSPAPVRVPVAPLPPPADGNRGVDPYDAVHPHQGIADVDGWAWRERPSPAGPLRSPGARLP